MAEGSGVYATIAHFLLDRACPSWVKMTSYRAIARTLLQSDLSHTRNTASRAMDAGRVHDIGTAQVAIINCLPTRLWTAAAKCCTMCRVTMPPGSAT